MVYGEYLVVIIVGCFLGVVIVDCGILVIFILIFRIVGLDSYVIIFNKEVLLEVYL